MRNIILLILLASLTGCFATRKRCLNLYPPTSSRDSVVHEAIRDSIVFKDTTVFVSIPGETITDSVPFPVYVEKSIKIDTARAETAFAKAKAYYSNRAIHIILEQKTTDLEIRLDNALRESYQWKEKYTSVLNKQVVRERYIPGVYKIALWMWVGVFAALLLYVVLKTVLKR